MLTRARPLHWGEADSFFRPLAFTPEGALRGRKNALPLPAANESGLAPKGVPFPFPSELGRGPRGQSG